MNVSIYTTWTTYMTVNTAIVGWILTKKSNRVGLVGFFVANNTPFFQPPFLNCPILVG